MQFWYAFRVNVCPFQVFRCSPVCRRSFLCCTFSLSGTGASCIYPLLGSKLNGWRFLATEIDKDSVTYALSNVQRNSMDTKIKGHFVYTGCFQMCAALLNEHWTNLQVWNFKICLRVMFIVFVEFYWLVSREMNSNGVDQINWTGIWLLFFPKKSKLSKLTAPFFDCFWGCLLDVMHKKWSISVWLKRGKGVAKRGNVCSQ